MASKDGPLDIIVAAFDTEGGADEALQRLERAQKMNLIAIENVAIIRKDAHGKVHLEEPGQHPVRKGMGRGALVGAVLGLIFPPSILASAVAGGAVGGLIGKLRDSGLDDSQLRQAAEGLIPSSSAVIAVIEHTWVAEVTAFLQGAGARITTAAVKADIARQLREQSAARP